MVNRVVAENQLAGNPQSQWDISFATNWTIEGFATEISRNAGETIDFKINTNSTNYRIDIYRLGYYGGAGARLLDTVQVQRAEPQVQPQYYRDSSTGLVDAGNWSVSASWPIPQTAVSGIYLAKLVRQDSTFGQNHIAFIVREDSNPSDIVFQTSDTTWQAYNVWGGVSLYGGDGPGQGTGGFGRAYKVSYNRPIVTRWGGYYAGPQDWIFSVEYPTIRWLERNGYDVTYISGVDTDRSANLLTSRRVFLSVGHDEYWSGQQRSNVEAARDAGVNLAFLSGNEVYWRTRWEQSAAGPTTPYRTLVCYKETREHDDIDPSGQWTGTFRDPRFAGPTAIGAGQPENALIGTMFTCDSYRLDTIEVPHEHAQMRFWRNTSVAQTPINQTTALTPGYLGYEWDSDLDNGFRPPGIIHLSKVVVDVHALLLDYGTTTGPGTAEHNLTLYRAPSGALVFGAGTVYWSWGLDDNHDAEQVQDDIRVKQAMVNLFADMGVQPQTLDPALTAATASTDIIPPVSTITAPPGPIPHDQAYTITGTATDVGGKVGGVEVSTDNGSTWHKASGRGNWTFSWTPSLGGLYTVRSRAVDDSGNIETPGPGIAITVTGPSGQTLFSPYAKPLVPYVADTSSVELGMKFRPAANGTITGVRFYKGAGNNGPHTGTLWEGNGTHKATVAFTNESAIGWQTALFPSPIPVTANTTYVVSYHTGSGYSAEEYYFYSAKTGGGITAPADGSSGGNGVYAINAATTFPTSSFHATSYWVDVVFHPASQTQEPPIAVDDTGFVTVRDVALQISAAQLLANDSDPNGHPLTVISVQGAVNGSVSFNSGTGIITFTPANAHVGGASFTYTISDGHGGTDTGSVSISVTDVPQGATLFLPSAVPGTATVNDGNPVELGMKFVPAANGVITGIRFYKGPQNTGTHSGRLWRADGSQIASVAFSNETASGWQTALFTNPPSVTANTTYVVSYHSNGFYSADQGYFTNAVTTGQLTAPSSSSSGGNGVYAYGATSNFPNQSYGASNYWVDVLFTAVSGNQPPTAVDDYNFSTTVNTPLNIPAAALLANDTDPNGGTLTVTGVSNPSQGSVSFNSGTNTVTFTPAVNQPGPATFTYSISDGQGGSANGTAHLFVLPTGQTLFPANAVPATLAVDDTQQVELGMKFVPATDGVIKGIRFYKGPQNTGTHTGTLWDILGNLKGSVTFAHESPSGWQTALFATPVAVLGGQTYVVSYHSSGYYSATQNGLGTAVTNGNLTAPGSSGAGGNGVYAYGATSFPTASYNATNYWVDVIFE